LFWLPISSRPFFIHYYTVNALQRQQVFLPSHGKDKNERVRAMQKDKENVVELAEAQTREALQKESAKKDAEIAELRRV
jgi:hypothetical protein